MNQQCLEYYECGRIPRGKCAEELGVCPASTKAELPGVNQGEFAGSCSWLVDHTRCGGVLQGTCEEKEHNCEKCDFFSHVFKTEGRNYQKWSRWVCTGESGRNRI